MSSEIKFVARANWSENDIADRLAHIVGYTGCPPFAKEGGYRWQLNASNDWWMDFNPETHEVTLAYRYGREHDGMLTGLKQFLEHVFG